MIKFFGALLIVLLCHSSLHAAEKIRISMTGFAGQFMTFPLAQKRGFLKEEGIEAEIIRISAAAGRAALSGGEVDYSTGIGGTAIGGEKGLRLMIDETRKTMKVTRDAPLSEIADLSIIREAQKELGIK